MASKPLGKIVEGIFYALMYHLEQLIVGRCSFRKGDRVWILESWGLVAGVIELVGEWAMSDKTKPNTPFIKVQYDFKTPQGRTDAHFWREEDLKRLRRQHAKTNCCFAPLYEVDQYLHGKCTECGENATPMEPDEFQKKYTNKHA